MNTERIRKNMRHRMIEMGITMVDLASVLQTTKSNMYERVGRMTPETFELIRVALVVPQESLESESPIVVMAVEVPDMHGWHSATHHVIKLKAPYPSFSELLVQCMAAAKERRRGINYDSFGC